MSNKLATYDAHTDLVMARLRSPKVKDTDEPVAIDYIVDLIDAACMAKGTQLDSRALQLTAVMFLRQLCEDKITADLTWEEVSKAVQDGTFGKYGKVYVISATTLNEMVWGYIESEERAKLIETERELKYGVDKAQDAKTNSFLDAHPEYAKIVLNNYIEQHQINKR